MDEKSFHNKVYKLKDGFLLRQIGESRMLIPLYQNVANFNGVIKLNETAELLIKILRDGSDFSGLLNALIAEYDVSADKAESDINDLIALLEQHQMLEE